jgi:hypothetical protein
MHLVFKIGTKMQIFLTANFNQGAYYDFNQNFSKVGILYGSASEIPVLNALS